MNQMARIKYQAGDAEERDDFTPEERARILNENKCSEVGLKKRMGARCFDLMYAGGDGKISVTVMKDS